MVHSVGLSGYTFEWAYIQPEKCAQGFERRQMVWQSPIVCRVHPSRTLSFWLFTCMSPHSFPHSFPHPCYTPSFTPSSKLTHCFSLRLPPSFSSPAPFPQVPLPLRAGDCEKVPQVPRHLQLQGVPQNLQATNIRTLCATSCGISRDPSMADVLAAVHMSPSTLGLGCAVTAIVGDWRSTVSWRLASPIEGLLSPLVD